jgi:hypothetical protein
LLSIHLQLVFPEVLLMGQITYCILHIDTQLGWLVFQYKMSSSKLVSGEFYRAFPLSKGTLNTCYAERGQVTLTLHSGDH